LINEKYLQTCTSTINNYKVDVYEKQNNKQRKFY